MKKGDGEFKHQQKNSVTSLNWNKSRGWVCLRNQQFSIKRHQVSCMLPRSSSNTIPSPWQQIYWIQTSLFPRSKERRSAGHREHSLYPNWINVSDNKPYVPATSGSIFVLQSRPRCFLPQSLIWLCLSHLFYRFLFLYLFFSICYFSFMFWILVFYAQSHVEFVTQFKGLTY